MIAPVPESYDGSIVELGAGNGCLTVRLARKCPKATIFACEINPLLAEHTSKNLANAGINGQVKVFATAAQDLLSEMAHQKRQQPGYIISGLPLGNFGKERVLELVRSIEQVLNPSGTFVQVQHLLLDRKYIQRTFPKLQTVPVLLNFPPAFIYYAKK
jgi:phospholipid N-methyltransferase